MSQPSTQWSQGSSILLVRQLRRPSGFDVARAHPSDEKLLYLFFFRTSRYNTLAAKLREVANPQTDSVNTVAVIFPILGLEATIESPEGFDPCDIQEQEFSLPNPNGRGENQYKLPPLIRVDGLVRIDQWHRGFVNPQVYDEMVWMYNLTRNSRIRIDRWSFASCSRISTMVDVPRTSHRLLGNAEIAAATGNPSVRRMMQLLASAFIQRNFAVIETHGGRSGSAGVGFYDLRTPVTKLFYWQPLVVGMDWGLLTSVATAALRWCDGGDVGYSDSDCRRLRRIATRRFQFPWRGEYTLQFVYRECPSDPDLPSLLMRFPIRY